MPHGDDRIKTRVYSPKQIALGSILGSVIAAIYFLRHNFESLGKGAAARNTLIWGVVFLIALWALYPLIPEKSPSYIFLAVLLGPAAAAQRIANKWQLTKQAIEQSDRFSFHSNWRVFFLSVGFFFATLILRALIVTGLYPQQWNYMHAALLGGEASVRIAAGDYHGAVVDLNRAIALEPNNGLAYEARAVAEQGAGDEESALADLNRVIELEPTLPGPYNNLAWLLATADKAALRDGSQAVALALKAGELSQWKDDAVLDTLAAAYARSGDFAKAIEWQQRAMEHHVDAEREKRFLAYRAGKAWPPD